MVEVSGPIARLNELISGISIATLTTQRPDGTLHSCPMMVHPAGSSGVLWFLAAGNSEKVEAVRTSQQVNVAFADPASQRYVSVSGFCELMRDRILAKQLWQPEYATWFRGGLEDPALVLMKVDIQQAEYWDAARGSMVPLLGFTRVQ
jgi:general stress protein 26